MTKVHGGNFVAFRTHRLLFSAQGASAPRRYLMANAAAPMTVQERQVYSRMSEKMEYFVCNGETTTSVAVHPNLLVSEY